MKEVNETLRYIFNKTLKVPFDEITPTATNNDLGMDSLDKVEVVMEIERCYKIAISDSVFDELKCFSDYVSIVQQLTGKP